MQNITLMQGDCLELMEDIPGGSVDLILTDPPYGVITKSTHDLNGWQNRDIKWDKTIPPQFIFEEANRVLRPNGRVILFSQEPYTHHLISSQIPSVPFLYRAVWIKNNAGNVLGCKQNMVSYFEDICIFSKTFAKHDFNHENPLRNYFKKVLNYIGFSSCKEVNKKLGHRRAEHCFYVTGVNNGSSQFSLCTEKTYKELVSVFGIDKMDGFLQYSELLPAQKEFNDSYCQKGYKEPAFNLWQGKKSKSNVLEYAKDGGGYHPTQKPVLLLEDLIKTFSNEGDTVLDFTMGSGSTGVACINTNRKFIGMELDPQYFEIAKKRIEDAEKAKEEATPPNETLF